MRDFTNLQSTVALSRHFTSDSGFLIQLRQKTKYFPLSPTPPSPMDIHLTMEMETKSHYLIGKAIWHAAPREQQLQGSISLGLLCHNQNALVSYNTHRLGTAFNLRFQDKFVNIWTSLNRSGIICDTSTVRILKVK